MSLSHVTKLGLLGPGAAEDKNAKNKEIKKSGKRDDKDSKKKKKKKSKKSPLAPDYSDMPECCICWLPLASEAPPRLQKRAPLPRRATWSWTILLLCLGWSRGILPGPPVRFAWTT